MRIFLTTSIFWACIISASAQFDIIELSNGSFEDIPHKGGGLFDIGIRGWYDCGELQFPRETPPDIHPVNAWRVTMTASDGDSYLGMVVRDNDSWESISQRIERPLLKDKCYVFTIDLARSDYYISASRLTNKTENYTEPSVLRIWGGTGVCGRQELLGESSTVRNSNWETFEFEFNPGSNLNYVTLEAFYKVPVLFPYNGHILIDNAASIVEVPCDGEEILAELDKLPEPAAEPIELVVRADLGISEEVSNEAEPQVIVSKPAEHPVEKSSDKSSLIEGLDADNIEEGQVIRVNHIYFAADSSRLEEKSNAVLEELYSFLKKNKNIVVEIGGHTSTVPTHEYCDDLSSRRAKEVALSLVMRGISPKRLSYKGYGKRKPLVPNDKYDMEARKKNQRVEIKILSLSYKETG